MEITHSTFKGDERNALIKKMSSYPNEDNYGVEMNINVEGVKDAKIWSWGKKNVLPYVREQLIRSNNIIPSLIKTKRDILLGAGLTAYKDIVENGVITGSEEVEMPKEIKEFFERVDIGEYLLISSKNYLVHANTFTEYIPADDKSKIYSMKAQECRHTRAEIQDDSGNIRNYYFSKQWTQAKGKREEQKIFRISAWAGKGDPFPGKKCIYHTGDDLISDEYYYEPIWWSGKDWIEVSNIVPAFHKANFRNGYLMRWHIEYPSDYFDDASIKLTTEENIKKAKATRAQNRKTFIDNMNSFLAGIENTGRAIFSSYEINRAAQKEFPGIKITAVKADIQDKALLELFDKSNDANISAQGVPPTLAHIQTPGKLSSGSEIRNAFMTYLAINTPIPRQILLEPIKLVQRVNGWDPNIRIGFKDVEITKLDENKASKQEVKIE